MGMLVENLTLDFGEKSVKLLVEGHFELSLAVFLKIKSQVTESSDWNDKFFGSASDIVDSVITYIVLILITLAFIVPIYILRNFSGITERYLKMRQHSIFFENLKSKGNCGYF